MASLFLGGGMAVPVTAGSDLPPAVTLRLQIFHIQPEETRRDVTKAVFTY